MSSLYTIYLKTLLYIYLKTLNRLLGTFHTQSWQGFCAFEGDVGVHDKCKTVRHLSVAAEGRYMFDRLPMLDRYISTLKLSWKKHKTTRARSRRSCSSRSRHTSRRCALISGWWRTHTIDGKIQSCGHRRATARSTSDLLSRRWWSRSATELTTRR